MRKLNKYQKIAARFLGNPKPNWGLEIKFAKNLFNMFPSEEFWEQLEYPKQHSLGYLFAPENKEQIFRQFQLFNLPEAQTHSINEEKFGEDLLISQPTKLKTLRDFLT